MGIFSKCALEQQHPHRNLSLHVLSAKKDFVNFQLLFFHCWKLTVRPGLKAVWAFFSKSLTLMAKNDLKEWLIPRGGCWHKSALLCPMQVLSEGMLQLYCCGNLVTLTTPDIKSSKSITTSPGLECMSNELITNKCSELTLFPKQLQNVL